jgi:hypothetical protein
MMLMSEQIRRMRQRFPAFEICFNGGWLVAWVGPLRPFAKTYKVKVVLTLKDQLDEIKIVAPMPQVWLVEPRLITSTAKAPGVVVPHIYPNSRDPFNSELCLFDPAAKEWSRDMAIAETTIPWTIDWLASYEGWHATGEWTGGGRDHARAEE